MPCKGPGDRSHQAQTQVGQGYPHKRERQDRGIAQSGKSLERKIESIDRNAEERGREVRAQYLQGRDERKESLNQGADEGTGEGQ